MYSHGRVKLAALEWVRSAKYTDAKDGDDRIANALRLIGDGPRRWKDAKMSTSNVAMDVSSRRMTLLVRHKPSLTEKVVNAL
jgi:hypothetical protein